MIREDLCDRKIKGRKVKVLHTVPYVKTFQENARKSILEDNEK